MSLNPAMSGDMDVEYRFAANQRTQWRSVTSNPYSTFSISAESAGTFKKPDLGTSLYIMNDVAGDGALNTFAVNLGASYGLALNLDSSSYLRGGLQLGFTQRSIDFDGLRFDEQYNGLIYDSGLSNQENFSKDNVSHLNSNLGLTFSHQIDDRDSYMLGVSLFNLNAPEVAFLDGATVNLDQRLNLHGEYVKMIADDWDVMPAAQAMWQGTYQEYLLGARFRHIWRDDYTGLRRGYIGGFARPQDGAYVMLGMDYDQWKVGLSYDLNFSPLEVASLNRGGLELSAIYMLDVFNEIRKKHRACPAWL
jgi:type IX secretion system PorP/SprF family membrane protein